MPANGPTGATDFHLARGQAVAVLGRVAVLAGGAVLAAVVSVSVLDTGLWRSVAGWSFGALGVTAAVLTVAAAVRVLRPPVLVRLDATGIEVRVLRGWGGRRLAWPDVRTVRRVRPAGGACLVVVHADGGRTVLAERMIAEGGAALAAALGARLDGAHRQRRLGRDDVARGGGDGNGGGGGGI